MSISSGRVGCVHCDADHPTDLCEYDSECVYESMRQASNSFCKHAPYGQCAPGKGCNLADHPESKLSNPKDIVGSTKARWWSVIPTRVLIGIGLALQEGALKYGSHNYRSVGVRASVYLDATVCGHLTRWKEGEDIDGPSGLSHIDKAIASLIVLRDSMLGGNWVDDRPIAVVGLPELMEDADKKFAELLAKYPNPVKPFTQKAVDLA